MPSLTSLLLIAFFLLSGPGGALNTDEEEVDRATHLINFTRACRAAPGKASGSADKSKIQIDCLAADRCQPIGEDRSLFLLHQAKPSVLKYR